MKRYAALLFVSFLLMSVPTISIASQNDSITKVDESLRRGEKRTTLDPKLFNDARVREAYRIAKEIPWVLDSIYCYCQCEESPAFRHKSLLSCYVDNHAAM